MRIIMDIDRKNISVPWNHMDKLNAMILESTNMPRLAARWDEAVQLLRST